MKSHRPEDAIQRAVFQHIKARGAPGLVAFHVPNGGKRKPVEAAIMKGLGVTAGVSDVICLHRGRFYAMELKADDGKPPSDAQLDFLQRVRDAGGYSVACRGLDRAIRTLEEWGLLRGAVT